MNPKALKVVAFDNHTLLVTFNNGEEKKFNATSILSYPVYEQLKDISFFKKATVRDGIVVWDSNISRDNFKSDKAFDIICQGNEELEKSNFKSAKLLFINANLIEPENKDIYVNMAIAEYFLKNYENALRIGKAARELDTLYSPPLVNSAVTLNAMRKYSEALKISNEILSMKDISKRELCAVFLNKSLSEHGLGNLDGALKSIDNSTNNCDEEIVLKSLLYLKNEWLAEQKKMSDQKDFVKQMLESGYAVSDSVSN